MSSKSARIAHFVSTRIDLKYIPAVRTANKAEDVIRAMVERELEAIEESPEYQQALDSITRLQQPVLEQLSRNVREIMSSFLPAIKDVKFQVETRHALKQSKMIVDDGTPTYLEFKGDGVKSLAALALMRHRVSEKSAVEKNLIIAVEEPESHLHAEAMHGLRKVLDELSEKHQIVITTHCPVFVQRNRPNSNIIVHKRRAKPAKSLEEIRKILGVRAADNLRSAEIVLVVEGEDDRVALRALLIHSSPELKTAITSGTLALDSLTGASNLAYKLGELRNAVCTVYAFLDNDKAGRDAVNKAIDQALLSDSEYTLTNCKGRPEAEMEDLYNADVFREALQSKYAILLDTPAFKSKKKWSGRMGDVFLTQGKQWNERTEKQVKQLVAAEVQAKADKALNEHLRGPFDALVTALCAKLNISAPSVASIQAGIAEEIAPVETPPEIVAGAAAPASS